MELNGNVGVRLIDWLKLLKLMYESWKFLFLKWWKNNKWIFYWLVNCVKLRIYLYIIIIFIVRIWSWIVRLCIGIVIWKNWEDNKDGVFVIENWKIVDS